MIVCYSGIQIEVCWNFNLHVPFCHFSAVLLTIFSVVYKYILLFFRLVILKVMLLRRSDSASHLLMLCKIWLVVRSSPCMDLLQIGQNQLRYCFNLNKGRATEDRVGIFLLLNQTFLMKFLLIMLAILGYIKFSLLSHCACRKPSHLQWGIRWLMLVLWKTSHMVWG